MVQAYYATAYRGHHFQGEGGGNSDYDALHFHMGGGSLKNNSFKVLFCEGGGHKK